MYRKQASHRHDRIERYESNGKNYSFWILIAVVVALTVIGTLLFRFSSGRQQGIQKFGFQFY
jgi:hypothetical protein